MAMLVVFSAFLPLASALSVLSRPERALRFLEGEGQRLGSEELLQLGNKARELPGDQMEKVKKMITRMIAQHQEAAAANTDHKAFCDKEMAASKTKLAQLNRELQKMNADQDLHSAKLAELKDSIADLHGEVAQDLKDRQKAANLRSKEAEAYKQAKQEGEQSVLELKRKARSDIRSEREAAIKAEEELTLKQVRAENKEEDAVFTYKKNDEDLAVRTARKTKEVEQKERQVVKMTHDLSQDDGDTKMTKQEMSAAKEYAEKIQTSCTVRQDPAKERQLARKAQLGSLKEAYGILTGEDIPR